MNHYNAFILFFLFYLLSITNSKAQDNAIFPKNEFRAVWVATIANIDWPKKNTDAVKKQQTDFIEILDTYKKLNYNAIIVQIRSNGDAFYPSKWAPWSRNLTGKEGIPPTPYFDPLEWMIAEAHIRGFEFHAWLNPFRATSTLKTEKLSPKHDVIKHPEWMISYSGKRYYNPALPEVQEHLTKIVEEVVQNYDIDAIHFDDYFYPYSSKGKKFNDDEAFKQYGNGLDLADWRRSNVNSFVQNVSKKIKVIKPWVQFGISPFGVWRNKSADDKGSDTQAGQTNYDDLFADPLTWIENNWIDYILPQLYWSLDYPKASYSKLLKWWAENTKNTAIYIGNSIYKINTDMDKKWYFPHEIPNQIDLTRTFKNIQGNAFFSAKWFINKNPEVSCLLSENQYKYPAIPLPVPNLRKKNTDRPKIVSIEKDTINCVIFLQTLQQNKIRYAVVYGTENHDNINVNNPSQIIDKFLLHNDKTHFFIKIPRYKIEHKTHFALTFIDYYGNESSSTYTSLKNR